MSKLPGGLVVGAFLFVALVSAYPSFAKTIDGNFTARAVDDLSTNTKFVEVGTSTASSIIKKGIVQKILQAKKKSETETKGDITSLKSLKQSSRGSKEEESQIQAKLKDINEKLKASFDANLGFTKKESDTVQYTEPDYLYQLDSAYIPNDLNLDTQWYLRSIFGQNSSIFSTAATINRPVIVAVVDTGVDYTHEDLQQSMWASATSTCVDASGSLIDGGCSNGYDFLDNDKDPYPTDGAVHGTEVASIIGATTDNGIGMASLSQNRVQIMSLRVADKSGLVSLDAAVNAIYFAVNNGADIINLSFSGPTYSQSLYDAIEYAKNHNVEVVVSAGNNYGQNLDTTPLYPASYTLDNIAPVAATDKTGSIASFSNYGPTTVKVAAPGYSMYVAAPGNTYTTVNGTSFATPLVAAYLAQGISEGNTATSTLNSIPSYSAMTYAVASGRELGLGISTSTVSDVNPFVRLASGALLNIYGKGGEIIDAGYTLDYQKTFLTNDPSIGYPLQVSPGSLVTSLTPPFSSAPTSGSSGTLSWASVAGATKYGAYLSKYNPSNDTTTNIFLHENLTGTSDSYSGLAAGIYMWNTAASKTNTATGPYNLTPVYVFQVAGAQNPPANAPTGVSPSQTLAPGYQISGTSLGVSWGSVTSATTYNLSWIDYSVGGTPTLISGISGTSYTLTGLAAGHNYYFKLAACNTYGCSPYSTEYYFYKPATNLAPATPTVSGATSGTVNTTYSATFNSTDPNPSDTLTYYIDWGDGSSRTTQVGSPGVTVTGTHTYTSAGTYCVKAYAMDNGSLSSADSACKNVTISGASGSPDIIPEAISLGVSGATPGSSLPVTFSLKNNGGSSVSSAFVVSFYLAPQAAGASTQYSFCTFTWRSPITVGTTLSTSTTCTLPSSSSGAYGSAGYYNVVMSPDSANAISEGTTGESNNLNSINGVGYSTLAINSLPTNGTVTQSLSIGNIGTQTAGLPFTVNITSSGVPNGTTVYLSAVGGTPSVTQTTINSNAASVSLSFGSAAAVTLQASTGGAVALSNTFTVQGTAVSNTLNIRIVDSSKTPITGAVVTANCVVGLTTCASTPSVSATTSASGIAALSIGSLGAVSPNLGIKVTYQSTTQDLGTIDVGTPVSYLKEYTLPTNFDVTHTPIILVPGIMGSTVGGPDVLVPYLPGGYVPAKDLYLADADAQNLFKPAINFLVPEAKELGWTKLENALTLNGYQMGKTIIPCPYDWRLSDDQSATIYLQDCINKAIQANPQASGKVDVVAHSQGGLVTRAYMQTSNTNAAHIRKLAFIATPMQGATDAYFAWEGGEAAGTAGLILASTLQHSGLKLNTGYGNSSASVFSFLGSSGSCTIQGSTPAVSNNQSVDAINVLASSWRAINGDTSQITANCLGQAPVLLTSNILGSGTANQAVQNPYIARAFMHANAPALKQLLPTYAFLKSSTSGTPTKLSQVDNEFLHALNGEACSGSCKDADIRGSGASAYSFNSFATAAAQILSMQFFYADDLNTDQDVIYGPAGSGLYEDGAPLTRLSGNGDGTVPSESITPFITNNSLTNSPYRTSSSNYDPSASATDDHNHGRLIGASIPGLLQYIVGSGAVLNSASLDAITPHLNIVASGAIQVLVTDPNSKNAGVDSSGTGSNSIPGATVDGGNNKAVFGVDNPVNGTYTLTISGPQSGDYDLYVDYGSNTQAEPHEFYGYHNGGSSETLTFTLNSQSSNGVFVFTQAGNAPQNIKVTKQGILTRVSWSAPSVGTPSKYRVYSKAPNDASVAFVGETTALQYDTTYPFAGSNSSYLRAFEVSAVDGSGKESFLTLPVQNDDTDGDGIPDSTETTIGTSATNLDTDGDGLTDGQEYFLFHTDPTLADSDHNGVNDYQQVINIVTGSAATSTNLVLNPSFITPDAASSTIPQHWYSNSWGTNNASFTYPVAGQTDSTAAKTQITTYTDGDAKWVPDFTTVIPGHSYTYSNAYKADTNTTLVVQYQSTSSSYSYAGFVSIPSSPSSWNNASITFTPPTGTVYARVFHLLSSVGSLTIDDAMLVDKAASTTPAPSITFNASASTITTGQSSNLSWSVSNADSCSGTNFIATTTSGFVVVTPATSTTYVLSCSGIGGVNTQSTTVTVTSSVNLLLNPSLVLSSGGLPLNWAQDAWGTNTHTFTYPVTGRTDSSAAKVQVTAYTSGDAKWISDKVPVTAGHSYNYLDWYTASSSSTLTIEYTSTGGSLSYAGFNSVPASALWATSTVSFTPPAGTASVRVFHLLESVGTLTIDDASITDLSASSTPTTPVISIAPSSISNGTVGQSYSQTLTASSTSTGTFTWSIASSSLPTGLSLTTTVGTSTTISGFPTVSGTSTFSIKVVNGTASTTQSYTIIISAAASSSNLVPNPSFVIPDGTLPQNWYQGNWGTNTTSFTYPVTGRTDSSAAKVQMTAYTTGDAKWFSDGATVTAGHTYLYSDYYQGTIPTTLSVEYTSSTSTVWYTGFTSVATSTSWVTSSLTFTPPVGVVSARVFHTLAGVGSLTIDDVSLIDQSGTTTPSVSITPSTVPSGTVGQSYSQLLTASTTASGPFTWSITSGSLPAGLNLGTTTTAATTTISGTPTASATSTFSVKVTNGTSSTTQSYTLGVAASGGGGASTSTIALAATSTSITSTFSNTVTKTWTHTVSGTDPVIILTADIWQDVPGTGVITSVKWNGGTFTKVAATSSDSMESEIWYLLATTTGSKTMSVTVTGDTDAIKLGASTFNGVAQISPLEISNTATGLTGNPSASVNVANVGDLIVATLSRYTTTNANTNRTSLYKSAAATSFGAASYQVSGTTGSQSDTYTGSSANDWSMIIAAFKPSVH